MSAIGIDRILLDLSSEHATEPASNSAAGADVFENVWSVSDESDHDRQLVDVAKAFDEGRTEGRTQALAEIEVRLKRQQAQFESTLTASREAWVKEQSDVLARSIANSLTALELKIAGSLAQALGPLVQSKVRHAALEELTSAALRAASFRNLSKVYVRGPDDLVAALGKRLEESGVQCEAVVAPVCEVEIAVGDTAIVSNFGAWLPKIEDLLK